MTESETWKTIPGFDGVYEVSDLGRVRSVGRDVRDKNGVWRHRSERILNPTYRDVGRGQLSVGLYQDGKCVGKLLSRLVLETFEGQPPAGKPYAILLDSDPMNNRLSNLQWGSKQPTADPKTPKRDKTPKPRKSARSSQKSEFSAYNTYCPNGHELIPENIFSVPERPGVRECYTCIRQQVGLPVYLKTAEKKPSVTSQKHGMVSAASRSRKSEGNNSSHSFY